MAMELVDGESPDRMIAREPLPIVTALDYAIQVASALGVAHASGIVHRDTKPANLIVTRGGLVKVLDFGVAKLFDKLPSSETMTAVETDRATTVGTPAYMSPEQVEGRPVDGRADIFALGVLYEMLTGLRPFAGETSFSIVSAILLHQTVPLRATHS